MKSSVMLAAAVLLAISVSAQAETRAYDLRDILIAIPNYIVGEQQPAVSKEERLASITAAVRGALPVALADAAELREVEGQLIVTTDDAGHAAIKRVLNQMRVGRSRQVLVECRVLNLGNKAWAALNAATRERLLVASIDPARSPVDFAAEEAAKFLDSARQADTSQLTAPRLTCFNGQRASIVVSGNGQMTFDKLRFDARPATTPDGSSAAVSFEYEMTETHDGKPVTEKLAALAIADKGHSLAYILPPRGNAATGRTVLLLTSTPIVQREVAEAKK